MIISILRKDAPMNIELTPKQERILHDALQQGRFQSVDEALDAALRSLSTPTDAAVTKPRLTPVEAAAHIRDCGKAISFLRGRPYER